MMDRARAIARYGVPSIVGHCKYSLKLQSLNYIYKQNHNYHHLTEVNYGFYQGLHLLSSRLNASIPCPVSIPHSSIGVG